ncbi:MAG TPA: hypothetical protein VG603_04980 [Chitinophagales bacterium]|nr:hypothetical protein [Chitinophagales bacterium]
MKVKELVLYSKAPIDQANFYEKVMGLPLKKASREAVKIQIGETQLVFEKRDFATNYHFAVNIPSGKENEALAWLKPKVAILAFDGREVVDFPNWNAKSVYFHDADGNIVELIARRDLDIIDVQPFSAAQWLSISEIGIGTTNIEDTYKQLNGLHPLPIYWGDFGHFCAAGDEHGLFILADINKKKWFPTDEPVYPSAFSMRGDYNFDYNGEAFKKPG